MSSRSRSAVSSAPASALRPFFILGPGAWAQGPELWQLVHRELGGNEHALMLDMPKETLQAEGAAIDAYIEAAFKQVESALLPGRQIVLVHHSAGGVFGVLFARRLVAAGHAPAALILVTAFVPLGEPVLDLRPRLRPLDRANARARMAGLPASARALPRPAGADLEPYYTEGLSASAAEALTAHLLPGEPFVLLDTPADVRDLAAVCPIHYVYCTQDHALPYEVPLDQEPPTDLAAELRPSRTTQRWLVERLRQAGITGREVPVAAGHNAPIVAPAETAAALREITALAAAVSPERPRRWRWLPFRRAAR